MDSRKNFWLSNANYLYRYNVQKLVFKKFQKNKNHNIKQFGIIQSIVSNDQRIWIVYQKGFFEERDYLTHKLIKEYNIQANFDLKTMDSFNLLFVDSHNYL